MYDFMATVHPELENRDFTAVLHQRPEDAFRIWLEAGFSGSDALSEKCVDLYAEIIGGVAGNWALKLLPRGGVYLLGGVLQKNQANFQGKASVIMESFLARPNHTVALLRQVPVFVVNAEVDVGLRGVLRVAREELLQHRDTYF